MMFHELDVGTQKDHKLDANKGLNSKTLHFLPSSRFLGL